MIINFKKLHPKARIPQKAGETEEAKLKNAGYDLFSPTYFKLEPFERKIIPLGIAMEIPTGYYGKIVDRSGHAAKRGIHVLAGTIDSSYRGDVGVVLINFNAREWLQKLFAAVFQQDRTILSQDKFFGSLGTWEVKEGDAIAQIIFRKHEEVEFKEVGDLSASKRGAGGYGSTDKKS